MQQGATDSTRATGSAAVRTAAFYIDYDASADEYTVSDVAGAAGFEGQGDGSFLLTAAPTGTTARQRKRGSEYLLYSGT